MTKNSKLSAPAPHEFTPKESRSDICAACGGLRITPAHGYDLERAALPSTPEETWPPKRKQRLEPRHEAHLDFSGKNGLKPTQKYYSVDVDNLDAGAAPSSVIPPTRGIEKVLDDILRQVVCDCGNYRHHGVGWMPEGSGEGLRRAVEILNRWRASFPSSATAQGISINDEQARKAVEELRQLFGTVIMEAPEYVPSVDDGLAVLRKYARPSSAGTPEGK